MNTRLKKNIILAITLLYILPLLYIEPLIAAEEKSNSSSTTITLGEIKARADAAMREKKYSRAINLYKEYLKHDSDYNIWIKLAISYFYYGFPKKALQILQSQNPPSEFKRAHNLYYQGLSLLTLKKEELAKDKLKEAAVHLDKYGYEAIFEMCVLAYNDRNKDHVNYWARLYQMRNPRGRRIEKIKQIQQLANNGSYSKEIKGATLPNLERPFYRYHKLSLSKYPHFWLMQFGGDVDVITTKAPNQFHVLNDNPSQTGSILATFGIGLGPLETKSTTSMIGYNYKINWLSTQDRFSEWKENMDSFSNFFDYFPFQLDLMERYHQIYGDFAFKLNNYFSFGMYSLFEIVRAGSSLGDDTTSNSAITLSEKLLLTPWLKIEYLHNIGTAVYLYLNRKYEEDFTEKSFSMYSFDNHFPISILLENYFRFPRISLNLKLNGYYFDYTFNDPWMDKNRMGGLLYADYTFLESWRVNLMFSYFIDAYKLELLVDASKSGNNASAKQSVFQERNDSGFIVKGGLAFLLGDFYRFDLNAIYIQSSNADFQIFDRERLYVEFLFTIGFPNSVRSIELMEKFEESNIVISDI